VRLAAGRYRLVLVLLSLGLLASVLLAVGVGAVGIPPTSAVRLIAWRWNWKIR